MQFPISVEEWQRVRQDGVVLDAMRKKARELGVDVDLGLRARQDARGLLPGARRHRLRDRQVAGGRPVRRPALDGDQDGRPRTRHASSPTAIHAELPDKMLAYNLSPSFNWDTTGMSDERDARSSREELGKLGFVFNFITYGGHQIDGLAAEEFATALRRTACSRWRDCSGSSACSSRPYRTPQTLVGGPRADAALMALSGRTATTKAMGKGSTQFQHLVQTEVPTKLLEEWLATVERAPRHRRASSRSRCGRSRGGLGAARAGGARRRRRTRRPPTSSSRRSRTGAGAVILSVRDQNTFDVSSLRRSG